MIYKFYDTKAFLLHKKEKDVITLVSSISNLVDADEVFQFYEEMLIPFTQENINPKNDSLIALACAYAYDSNQHPDETIFVTTNPEIAEIANRFFGEDSIELLRADV